MKNRRVFLATSAAALPAFVLATTRRPAPGQNPSPDTAVVYPSDSPGPSAGLIPNVPVVTHDGRKLLFYDDLVKGRIVAVHFMSVRGDEAYPVTSNLARVARILGGRMGRDLFFYSVSADPEHDTPEVLRDFARSKGAGPGWTFLTGRRADIDFLQHYLFVRRDTPSGSVHLAGHHGPGCSIGLARYGNETLARWGSFPLRITPESIAERFSWVGLREEA